MIKRNLQVQLKKWKDSSNQSPINSKGSEAGW